MKHPAFSAIFVTLILAGCAAKSSQATSAATPGQPAAARTLSQQGRDPAEFPAYVDSLKSKALAQGITQQTLDTAFAEVHFVDRVIKADRAQPEKKITLDDYLQRVLTASKIEQARTELQQHQDVLHRVSQRYGVAPPYIVALWAMESNFGKLQGKEDVISALSTLAFEGRREAFFTRELMAALQVMQQGHLPGNQMLGSWAGAMGQNQFMPSSFLQYGVDGDGDGKIDIWNNSDDVFASTANYLAKEGWHKGASWGCEVVLPVDFNTGQAGTKKSQSKTVGEWEKLGVRMTNSVALPDTAQRAWIILPDDIQGRAFMVYDNFRTIMQWNRSYYFAISIGRMADAISQ